MARPFSKKMHFRTPATPRSEAKRSGVGGAGSFPKSHLRGEFAYLGCPRQGSLFPFPFCLFFFSSLVFFRLFPSNFDSSFVCLSVFDYFQVRPNTIDDHPSLVSFLFPPTPPLPTFFVSSCLYGDVCSSCWFRATRPLTCPVAERLSILNFRTYLPQSPGGRLRRRVFMAHGLLGPTYLFVNIRVGGIWLSTQDYLHIGRMAGST